MTSHDDTSPGSVAATLSGLAHPQRMRIVGALVGGRQYVSELARRLEMNRPLLHMHLRRLEQAGLVTSALELSPDGKAMRFYEVAPFDVHLTPATVAAAARHAAGAAAAETLPSPHEAEPTRTEGAP